MLVDYGDQWGTSVRIIVRRCPADRTTPPSNWPRLLVSGFENALTHIGSFEGTKVRSFLANDMLLEPDKAVARTGTKTLSQRVVEGWWRGTKLRIALSLQG